MDLRKEMYDQLSIQTKNLNEESNRREDNVKTLTLVDENLQK